MKQHVARRRWTNSVGVASRLLEAVLVLPVRIERVTTSQLELGGATSFTRIATIVELHGDGEIGRGEDVSYSAETQQELPAAVAARDDLVGTWTIGSLAEHLDAQPLHTTGGIRMSDKPGYHRWAVESAALDLALRQRGTNLADLVGATWGAVTVSLSMGLGTPPSADVVRAWLERDPSTTFKLDASMAWNHALVAELATCGEAVATVDMKALYHGDWIDNDYPTSLYEAVGHGLPGALIEDAKLGNDVLDALDEDALRRLAWDYPITAPADVPGLRGSTARFSDLRPGAVNIKPSRFGSLERLLGTIALCDAEGLPCYAGGQFELGIGRTHVQAIASLCFPDAPNDCAPVMFHGATPASDDVPLGPVVVPADHVGFGWDAPTRATPIT
jgi:L-alanine-DL-glutamate epimerase-like enolase superfamily enzyme